jgi:hypothetical protein
LDPGLAQAEPLSVLCGHLVQNVSLTTLEVGERGITVEDIRGFAGDASQGREGEEEEEDDEGPTWPTSFDRGAICACAFNRGAKADRIRLRTLAKVTGAYVISCAYNPRSTVSGTELDEVGAGTGLIALDTNTFDFVGVVLKGGKRLLSTGAGSHQHGVRQRPLHPHAQ